MTRNGSVQNYLKFQQLFNKKQKEDPLLGIHKEYRIIPRRIRVKQAPEDQVYGLLYDGEVNGLYLYQSELESFPWVGYLLLEPELHHQELYDYYHQAKNAGNIHLTEKGVKQLAHGFVRLLEVTKQMPICWVDISNPQSPLLIEKIQ